MVPAPPPLREAEPKDSKTPQTLFFFPPSGQRLDCSLGHWIRFLDPASGSARRTPFDQPWAHNETVQISGVLTLPRVVPRIRPQVQIKALVGEMRACRVRQPMFGSATVRPCGRDVRLLIRGLEDLASYLWHNVTDRYGSRITFWGRVRLCVSILENFSSRNGHFCVCHVVHNLVRGGGGGGA